MLVSATSDRKCTKNSSHTDVKSQSWLDNQQKHVGLTWQKYQSSHQTLALLFIIYLDLWLWLLSHEVVTINPLVLSSDIYLHLWSDWGTGFTQWWWKSQTKGHWREYHVPCYFLVCMKISVPTKMRILRQTEEIKLCQCHLQSKL